MNSEPTTCDEHQLRLALQSDGSGTEQAALLDHIEHCISCQSRLEELAADDDDWQKAGDALSSSMSDELDADAEFDLRRHARWSDRSVAWTETMAKQLLAAPSHPEMLGRLGRYEVERLIGAGGMGVVFKAFDTELNRPVAIKVLAPYLAGNGSARKRFAREARAAAAVVHEHVVPIHNVETDQETPFLVMQFIAGESLQARLDRQGPLELCELLRIGRQVASGLAAAHQQGLVHRDIKPSNILLEQSVERALITDFGLARAADDASVTHTGFHPGTPQYMSPEQANGAPVDHRSDLFSLGSVLYAMCTGRPPFRAETTFGVLRRIRETEPRSIREINADVPEWLDAIVMKLLSKSPEDRFATTQEVASLLEQCLAHVQQPTMIALPNVGWESVPTSSSSDRIESEVESRVGMESQPTTRLIIASLALVAVIATSMAWNRPRTHPPPSHVTPSSASSTESTPEPSTLDPALDWDATQADLNDVAAEIEELEATTKRDLE